MSHARRRVPRGMTAAGLALALIGALGVAAQGRTAGGRGPAGPARVGTAPSAARPPRARVRAPVREEVAAGALAYVTFGCVVCHGRSGEGVRVPNVSGAATIPPLGTAGRRDAVTTMIVRYYIQHGVVLQVGQAGVYMPVWGPVISDQQVSDLVAYINAGLPPIAGIAPQPVRTDLGRRTEGAQLYLRYGCAVCHNYSGFGGIPNPAAPEQVIPPLRGPTFERQFARDRDLAYVLRYGALLRDAPITSMPVWDGLLSDQQINALVAYIRSWR